MLAVCGQRVRFRENAICVLPLLQVRRPDGSGFGGAALRRFSEDRAGGKSAGRMVSRCAPQGSAFGVGKPVAAESGAQHALASAEH